MAGEDKNSFDVAAEKASAEFQQVLEKMSPEARKEILNVQNWWKKWFMSAGHKRLGRIIMNVR